MKLKQSATIRTRRRFYDRHFTRPHSCNELDCKKHEDANGDKWVDGDLK